MRTSLFAIAALALVGGFLIASGRTSPASASQASMTTTLSGSAEVPGPGSADGTGQAMVTIDPAQATVCYDLTVTLAPPAAAAHIHRGAADAAGPVVVPFDAPSSGSSSGCVQGVDAVLIADIMQAPTGFYVNIHNPDFPAGAIRGQLGQ